MSPTISFAAAATPSKRHSVYTPPQKKQKMSITQTYFLAHSARGKLSKEAARADHDLRLLVGHANMLDSLMIDLANAEQEQERWFNRTLSGARDDEDASHEHAEMVEEPEADWEVEDAESSDDESDFEEESIKPTTTIVRSVELDMEEDDETDGDLALTRTVSHHSHSPPELTNDSESDSEEEHMPSSPPNLSIDTMTEKQRQAIATSSFYEAKDASLSPAESQSFEADGFFLPSRSQPTIIAAY